MGIVHVVYCNLEGKIWLNLNLSCYIQQEAEEAFCILSLSTFEGLVFQKKLQLASNFFYSNSQELSFHFVKILDNRN